MLTKEQFIDIFSQIERQNKIDKEFSMNMSKAFPNAFQANLLPNNEVIKNGLIKLLEIVMNDTILDEYGYSFITYFIYELDFGRDNNRLKVYSKEGKEIPMSNSEELYDFLIGKIPI